MARTVSDLSRDAVAAERQGAEQSLVDAMLRSAAQQDRAQRMILYVVAGLLAASLTTNVLLVAWVLDRSLSISAWGVDLDAGTTQEGP